MARADFSEDDPELNRARGLLASRYGLRPEEAQDLLAAARAESDRAASLFHFTQTLNRQLEPEGKVELMQMLWDVAYADGRLDKYEDALMHKLADLLYVPVRDLMRAKERAREKARER